MIDFKNVLGSLLESGLAPSASHRMGSALGPQGGGLASMLEGLAGRSSQGGSQVGSVLSDLLGGAKRAASDTRSQAQAGNPMAAGGIGALAGAVLGGFRGSPAKGALGGAALAVLGQIAMQALQRGAGGTASATAQPGAQPGLAEASASSSIGHADDELPMQDQASAELLLRAMINAAKADGQIDGAEMNAILAKLDEAGADQEAKSFVLEEMRRPLDVDALVAGAKTPGLAAAVYAASTMAIKVDTVAEQNYLAQLANRLGISPQVRASLDASLGVGRA
jgi:uncharacterized membrane protein YebE (DUF533 family)